LQLTRDLHQCYPLLVKMHSTKSHCAIVACVEFRTHVYMQHEYWNRSQPKPELRYERCVTDQPL
jgi:hypothetical protein